MVGLGVSIGVHLCTAAILLIRFLPKIIIDGVDILANYHASPQGEH